jgi:hypothetical protein
MKEYQFDMDEAWSIYRHAVFWKDDKYLEATALLADALNELEMIRPIVDECRKKIVNMDRIMELIEEHDDALL